MGMNDSDIAGVVATLKRQHRQIRRGFARVARGGPHRDADWAKLRRLLAAHEAFEKARVHPVARKRVPAGDDVVVARLVEEALAQRTVRQLGKLGPDDPRFPAMFRSLRRSVLMHARREEREEFAELRRAAAADGASRRGLARLFGRVTRRR